MNMKNPVLVSYHIEAAHHSDHQLTIDASDFHVGNLSQNLEKIAAHLRPLTPHGTIEIQDIIFPSHFMPFLPGPAFGKDELRKILNIKERPLSCFLLSTAREQSLSPLLEQTYLGLLGGVDMVLVPSAQHNPLHRFLEGLDMLLNEQKNCTLRTKKHTLLIPSIPSGPVREMQEYILSSQERGIRIVMIDAGKAGLTGIQQLRSFCSEIGVLLGVENWEKLCSIGRHLTVSHQLMLKLIRMAGADVMHYLFHSNIVNHEIPFCFIPSDPAFRRGGYGGVEEFLSLLSHHHDRHLRHLHPTMPLIGPLQKIHDLETIIKSCGYDLILETHDLIAQHPGGIKAGSRAFTAAIDAAFHGIDQKSAAKKIQF